MSERWLPIPGYVGLYEVSDYGSVRSLTRERITSRGRQRWPGRVLKPFVDTTGYRYVNLGDGASVRKSAVHRLVLMAFVGLPEAGQHGCHFDGDRRNNHLANLRWDSPVGNSLDAARHGTLQRGEKSARARLTEDVVQEIRASKESSLALSRRLGVAGSTVRAVRLRTNWRHVS